MFGDLLTVAKEIRDLMRQKADQEKTQALLGAPNQSDESPEVADATTQERLNIDTENIETANGNEVHSPEGTATTQEPLNTETANVETNDEDDWPNDETIVKYRDRCARYKSECEKMQVALGCFNAHLSIVGGDEYVIRYTERLQYGLLGHVQYLEKALGVTPDERGDAMGKVKDSFYGLWDLVCCFAHRPHHKDADRNKVTQWRNIILDEYFQIRDLVNMQKFGKCMNFINELFSDLEMIMGGLVEALTTFEEKSASEWLATQKIGDLETRCNDYMSRVFPPMDDIRAPRTWPEPDEIQKFMQRLGEHKKFSNEMRIELDHLVSHYAIIGGDKAVIEATMSLKQAILSFVQNLESAVHKQPTDFRTKMCDVVKRLLYAVIRFQNSLYHQKHAFYFRKVKQWVTCTWIGAFRILSLLQRGEVSQCLAYMQNTFLSGFERAMIGIAHGEQVNLGENAINAVPEELKTFGKESLPKFLVDQMERDTTRYINLTTIATFFSSVTATTLQFTYAPLQTEASESLRGVVNLFWFLSLIFSVSSGVSSLLGLTWRKSSIYDSCVPPRLIRMWFDKAPMLFLIISAVAFVIGLNLFAYLSLQPRFVSLATNILTGLHGMCLLTVTLWFLYQLKHDSVSAGWIRIVMKSITKSTDSTIAKSMEWIRTCMEWIKTGPKWIWRIAKWPFYTYKWNKLHLRRNIFWAFGIDNRVARLNYKIGELDWSREWPGPHPLSRVIRRISYPIKKCWLETKKVIFDMGHSVWKHICGASREVNTEGGEVELGETGTRDDTEAPEETLPERRAEKAENKFRRSLQKIFTEAEWVDSVMDNVERWGNGYESYAERRIGRKLRGYPDLVKEFRDRVCPALIEARIERRERERREWIATRHVSDNRSAPALTDEDTTTFTSQSSQTTTLDDVSGPSSSALRKTGSHQDSPSQQHNRPPPPDELFLFTASTSAEALEPTSGDPNLTLDVSGIAEGFILTNEIEGVASTPEYEDERSRAAQRKGKARE